MDVVDTLPDIDGLWDFSNPAESEAAFRAVIPLASEREELAYLAELFTQIARAETLQRKFHDAEESIARAEGLGVEDPRVGVRILLERGRILNSSGKPAEAQPLFEQAVELGQQAGEEYLAIDAAHMVAITQTPDEALNWNLKALNMALEAKDKRAASWEGSIRNNLGWTYHDRAEYDDALAQFEGALAFERSLGREDRARIASYTVGRCLRSQEKYEEALELQRKNLVAAETAGLPGGFIHEELGECLLALGQEGESRPHFARAAEVLSQDSWLVEQEPERISRLRELGGVESGV